jgi:hypothetical protein
MLKNFLGNDSSFGIAIFQMTVFCTTLRGVVEECQSYGAAYCLHLQMRHTKKMRICKRHFQLHLHKHYLFHNNIHV